MLDEVCDNCGGTDFYNEQGLFFCNECQIQTQNTVEQAFQDAPEKLQSKSSRKISSSDKSKKHDKQITSWECYNYVMLGLTHELIELGADINLKKIIKILWLRYLEKIQVFKIGKDVLPKLQAVNSAKDAEIIYGKSAKSKRKRGASSTKSGDLDSISVNSSMSKAEQIKNKRAYVTSQYEESQVCSNSLHNETLTSLQSSSDKQNQLIPIIYNKYSNKVLRKKMSQSHLKKHKLDFNNQMKCHKNSYPQIKAISSKYVESSVVLSPNKLYIILYLGLLINKDKIQLGDLLRFINEGHLSYNNYSHFFPEHFEDKELNFQKNKKHQPLSNINLRSYTFEMAKFLDVDKYITSPNLLELCERYCKELNLPDEICNHCKNIIVRTKVKMDFRSRRRCVPNYEGRVLSIIIFVLKLLWGLDDVTEYILSDYANILNKSSSLKKKMFNIINWLKFLDYRNIILNHHHFPTNFYYNNDIVNTNLFLHFLNSLTFPEIQFSKEQDKYHHVLTKLNNYINRNEDTYSFPKTFTPFHDYSELLLYHGLPKDYLIEILQQKFTFDSVIYLTEPYDFLNIVKKNKKLEIIHGGANNNWVIETLVRPQQIKSEQNKERKKMMTVKLSSNPITESSVSSDEIEKEEDSKLFQYKYKMNHEVDFLRNEKYFKAIRHSSDINLENLADDLKDEPPYTIHFNPFERYWITGLVDVESISFEECEEFLKKYPKNFHLIFKECQRIAQQTELDLMEEFLNSEFYLAFVSDYSTRYKKPIANNKLLKTYVRKITKFW